MSYLEPALPLLLVLGLVGLIGAWRGSVAGRRPLLLTVSIAGVVLLSTNLFAWFLSLPLEIWYDDKDPAPRGTAEAVVILAGAVNPPLPNQPYSYAGADTYRGLQRGVWLYKHWQPLPILVCGGSVDDVNECLKQVFQLEDQQPVGQHDSGLRSKRLGKLLVLR